MNVPYLAAVDGQNWTRPDDLVAQMPTSDMGPKRP